MQPGHRLWRACLATLAVMAMPSVSGAAEAAVVAQDLVNVRASSKVGAALWTRRLDSYTLQIALPHSVCVSRKPVTAVADQRPQDAAQESQGIDRSVFFIGNSIANLRGLDPCFGDRTLTMIDGRRTAPGSSQPDSARPPQQAAPQKVIAAPSTDPPRLQVWLLRADGTQIPPLVVATETSTAYGCGASCPVSGKLYRFPLAEGAQALAVAISIDDDFYIEKLRPLVPTPATQ